MRCCNDSPIRIASKISRMRSLGLRWVIMPVLIAGIGTMLAFNIWLGLLSAGVLFWKYRTTRLDAARVTLKPHEREQFSALDQLRENASGGSQASHAHMMTQIIDQVLEQHPQLSDAKFVKAGILWHLYGDRDGARCHCRDLLSQIQSEDPLFEQVCDLYTATYEPYPAESSPPAFQHAVVHGNHPSSTPTGGIQAKVIPFNQVG